MRKTGRVLAFTLVVLLVGGALAQERYRKPPQEILDVIHAPMPPTVSLSPTRDYLLFSYADRYPPIAELAQPMLRLAGQRINPLTNGPHLAPRTHTLALKKIPDGKEIKIVLPAKARIGGTEWSPDGKYIAFTNTTPAGIELWVATVKTATARRIEGVRINAALGDSVQWLPGSKELGVALVPAGRGPAPSLSAPPVGPNVQESLGRAGPAPTFQDLLKSQQDEKLFEYYTTSQLAIVNVVTGAVTPVGKPAIFLNADSSPDGKYLLVTQIRRPFSYLYTANAFPKEVEVWNRAGKLVHKVASIPLADKVPIEGVPTGPRGIHWRPVEPATLLWTEALDNGDPRVTVPHRDKVVKLAAPFQGPPAELVRTEQRFAGMTWAADGSAILRDSERRRRTSRTFLWRPGAEPKLLWSLRAGERYKDPGQPVTKQLPSGNRVLWKNGDEILLAGAGASPEGDRPFLDRYNLTTGKSERVFRCDTESFESIVGAGGGGPGGGGGRFGGGGGAALLDDAGTRFITRRETPTEPPNYYIRSADGKERVALTAFTDPQPQIRGISKQLVTYKRADGQALSMTLYLPPNYKPGTRLPAVIWAYPREFDDPDVAGQIGGSTKRFTTISGPSHLLLLLRGYAVLDDATMPVVGDFQKGNDTYVEQIVASAKAAIDKAAEMGVIDPKRVGVGGHSYGAFMTANLLANSDLFKAGVARSGAYNRTLTPFGFQAERRTYWEAAETYLKMSPFMRADKLKTPILLIHGEADNNSGTFPIQSDRMYQALRGNGGAVRLVMLPHESHGYAARESIEHVLAETIAWFDKYVKGAEPSSSGAN